MKDSIIIPIVFFAFSISSCANNNSVEESRVADVLVNKSKLEDLNTLNVVIDSLIDTKEYSVAKAKLDSIILEDTDNAYYFFKRGVCETQLMMHDEAIRDFQQAGDMNYKKDVCAEMIKFNQLALKDNGISL